MNFLRCPKCLRDSFEMQERSGALRAYKCMVCGYEERGLYDVPLSDEVKAALAAEPERSYVAYLVWYKGRPSASDIVRARSVVPGLMDKPISELRAAFRGSSRYRLDGRFFSWEIKKLKEAASAFNMYIEGERVT